MKIPKWIITILLKKLGVMSMFNKFKAALSGKKTYLVALGMVVTALVEFAADGDAGKLINRLLEAFAFATARAAIAKAEV